MKFALFQKKTLMHVCVFRELS